MYAIPLRCVPQWQSVNGTWWAPESVNIHCPFCGSLTTFKLTDHFFDTKRKTIAASSRCPGGHEDVRFWAIDPKNVKDQSKECKALGIYPKPTLKREPISGIDKIPPDIGRAYVSTVSVFNAGVWPATATCCRRVVEGIAQNLLPEDMQNKPLAQQLDELKTKVDLTKPLTSLADALRKGGNLGAHFDLAKEPDESTASQMVDLLEYLIEYLYILPAQVESLHKTVAK